MIKLYHDLTEKINQIDFSKLWTGFNAFKFALYDDEKVCLGGQMFDKDERFIGNTSIKYNDEYIAIWNIKHSYVADLDLLASKIVHEMFHAFQNLKNEKRWANELLGLDYHYSTHNLSIKYQENKILAELYDHFDQELFNKFLVLRKYRQKHYGKELDYETKVEVIEGMANYIDLKALKQLNNEQYLKSIDQIKAKITDVSSLIPIRNLSYYIGALLLIICDENNILFEHTIGETDQTIYDLLSHDTTYINIDINPDSFVENIINDYHNKNENLICHFLDVNPCQIKGKYQLYGLDPMNTIKLNDYLYCKHFIAYFDLEDIKFIQHEFVAKIDKEFNILEVFY